MEREPDLEEAESVCLGRQPSQPSHTHTVILARPFVRVARPQTQEPSPDKTPIRHECNRAEPVDVPDATQEVRPYGKTQADDEAGGHGEHDRDGATTSETVAFDVFKVLAVHGGGKDSDCQLDGEFSSFANFGRIAVFFRAESKEIVS